MNRADGGEVFIRGSNVVLRSVRQAIAKGVGYVPENRLVQGLVMQQSVGKNVIITTIEKSIRNLRLLDKKKVQDTIEHWVTALNIKVPSIDASVQTLSGGNQQRVVLAKWLATKPKILILDGPTMGIDIAAKSSIHELVRQLASSGMGIILISDEVSEVVNNCNRILVMHRGRILREFQTKSTSEEDVQSFVNNTD